MDMWKRVVLAAGIFVLDLAVVVVPISALFIGYVIVVNPPWFRSFLDRIGEPGG